MNNKYSQSLLIAIISLITIGIVMVYFQNLYGFIPAIVGGLLCLGFKELESKPLEIGVLTVFSVKKPITVKGLTLVLDWLPIEIIGVDTVKAENQNVDFKERITVRCFDGATVTGTISVTFAPDYNDDPVGTVGAMSGGQKLILYIDNGGFDGVKTQLDDIITNQITEIGKAQNYLWMISNSIEIDSLLLGRLYNTPTPTTSSYKALGSARTMGIKIVNIQTKLVASSKLQAVDEDKVIEKNERDAEIEDIRTHKSLVDELMKGFIEDNAIRKNNGQKELPIPSYAEVEKMVDKQRTLKKGVRQVIEAGNLINFTQPK